MIEAILFVLGILILIADIVVAIRLWKDDADELSAIVGVGVICQVIFVLIGVWYWEQSPEQKYVACVFHGKTHSVEIPNDYCLKYLKDK